MSASVGGAKGEEVQKGTPNNRPTAENAMSGGNLVGKPLPDPESQRKSGGTFIADSTAGTARLISRASAVVRGRTLLMAGVQRRLQLARETYGNRNVFLGGRAAGNPTGSRRQPDAPNMDERQSEKIASAMTN